MTERFEDRAANLVSTTAALFQGRGRTVEARLLRAARAELDHVEFDNWNGGTDVYQLVIRLPVADFAQIHDESKFEASILEVVQRLVRTETNNGVRQVLVLPDASLDIHSEIVPTESAPWEPNAFRLFITHCSSIKLKAEGLKEALRLYQISGFVAHSDIEPTREWQDVIEAALQSMDGLAALVTPDFVASRWCDQEVGVAIGRRKLVVPLRVGADPHGFMGKYQGLTAQGKLPADVAKALFDILTEHDKTSERLGEVVLARFGTANSFGEAKFLMGLLEGFKRLPKSRLRDVEPLLKSNVDLREAHYVPGRFAALLKKHGLQPTAA